MTEIDTLRQQLQAKEAELLQTKLQLIETRITELQQSTADQELRLRAVEVSRTRFETLAWLACGGGAMSLINILIRLKA